MDIAIFNWKDWTHPLAGGAEEYLRQVARVWLTQGHRVRLFTSRGNGQTAEGILDGVEVTRRGSRWGVYAGTRRAFQRAEKPDVVLEAINTRPFQTPRFAGCPMAALIYQLAREFWFLELPYPVGWVGYHFLESYWLKPYRAIPTATLSPSTAADLQALGFERVSVVYVGCSVEAPQRLPPKETSPTLVFLGRLTRAKRPHHALEAFRIIRGQLPEAQLWVVGDGYLRKSLEAQKPPGVTFWGRVERGHKEELLAKAHLLLVPGVREGWGLVVTEANALGTPAVAYRVPGLMDSVKDGVTGLLTDPKPPALAEAALSLLRNPDRLRRLAEGAREDARSYSWERTAELLMGLLRSTVEGAG